VGRCGGAGFGGGGGGNYGGGGANCFGGAGAAGGSHASASLAGQPATTFAGGSNGASATGPSSIGGDGSVVITTLDIATSSGTVRVLPADVMQQVATPESGTCGELSRDDLNWAGVASGGWAIRL
jgi:hypothetical protein